MILIMNNHIDIILFNNLIYRILKYLIYKCSKLNKLINIISCLYEKFFKRSLCKYTNLNFLNNLIYYIFKFLICICSKLLKLINKFSCIYEIFFKRSLFNNTNLNVIYEPKSDFFKGRNLYPDSLFSFCIYELFKNR